MRKTFARLLIVIVLCSGLLHILVTTVQAMVITVEVYPQPLDYVVNDGTMTQRFRWTIEYESTPDHYTFEVKTYPGWVTVASTFMNVDISGEPSPGTVHNPEWPGYHTWDVPLGQPAGIYIAHVEYYSHIGFELSADSVFYVKDKAPPQFDTTAPAAVTDLAISQVTTDSVTVVWTAPGDDGNAGTASEYDIRYSTSPIIEANWDSATQCTGEPAPQSAGSSEGFVVTGLLPETTYYFALKTADEVPNWSELSNVASASTESLTPKFLTLPFKDCSVKIVEGWVYWWNPDPNAHLGIDYMKGDISDSTTWQSFDVVAAADGWAMQSEQLGSIGAYGKFVLVRHNNDYFSFYAHLESIDTGIPYQDRFSIDYNYDNPSKWKYVRRGEILGTAGNTGASDKGIHLHFEVQTGGYDQNQVDPYDLYKTRSFYPGGVSYTSSGVNYLWTTDPPMPLPLLEVHAQELSRIWTRDIATDLPVCNAYIEYSISNSGCTDVEDAQVSIEINGDTFMEYMLPTLSVGQIHKAEFAKPIHYDTSAHVEITASTEDSSDTFDFTVNADLPRFWSGCGNLPKLFITPNDDLVQSTLNDILQSYWMFPDWIGIRDWVGYMISYVNDMDQYGVSEYWALPKQTINSLKGDCEDFSILLTSLLRSDGWDHDKVYVVLGKSTEEPDVYHAWVILKVPVLGWRTIEPQLDALYTFWGDYFALQDFEAINVFNDYKCSTPIIIRAHSPVDIVVTGPDGLFISKQDSEIPDAWYSEFDLDSDGDVDDQIVILDRKPGDYKIVVVPEPGSSPTDTFTLVVTTGGNSSTLAEDVPIGQIHVGPYGVWLTEDGAMQILPVAVANGPYVGVEGSPIAFNGTDSYDPDGYIALNEWDFEGDGTYDLSSSPIIEYTYGDDFTGDVILRVTDDDGLTSVDVGSVTVLNVAPIVGNITAPVDPVPVNTPVYVTGNFTDPGFLDTHTADWNWGDGDISAGTITEINGSGNVTDSHTYTAPGVYAVKLTVTDDDGDSGQSVFQYLVVYDPSAGFVTGGGWIDSPSGAYTPEDSTDPDLTGKATFGFVSKYKKGATTPIGQTEFQFKIADLNFHSDNYDWLVVAGPKAMYKGTGTINGEGNYGFMLSAIDTELTPSTDVDLFRIKIWDKAPNQVIYDNQMDAADDADPTMEIAGGSIVIHKQK